MDPDYSENYPTGYDHPPRGSGRLLGFLLFLAIVGASVAFFFLYTKKKFPQTGNEGAGGSNGSSIVQSAPAEAMVSGLARELQNGNLDALTGKFAPDAKAEGDAARMVLGTLLGKLGYTIPGDEPVYFVGGVTGSPSYGLELESSSGRPDRVTFETYEYAPGDWRVSGIDFPQTLRDEVIASATGGKKAGDNAVKNEKAAASEDDAAARAAATATPGEIAALATTENFVQAALGRDYDAARAITDFDQVKGERIAALCFVFEEGSFTLDEDRPIVLTATNEDRSWAVVNVASPTWGSQADFGVELERDGAEEDAPWKVVGLNFSELLLSYAAATDAGKVAYSPMVENPDGGQSLLLYFEYDESVLHDRARRQLAIVAKLLRGDSERQLQITGHADALGAEDYNVSLSSERAANVRDYLAGLGVSPDQVVTVGAGEGAPLRPNTTADGGDNPEGRAHNRRAEVFLDFK